MHQSIFKVHPFLSKKSATPFQMGKKHGFDALFHWFAGFLIAYLSKFLLH
jgi:hypothetical protein